MTAIALQQQQEPSERLYLVEEEDEEEDYDVHWNEVNAEFARHQDSFHENTNDDDDDDDDATKQQYRHVSFDFEEIDDVITIRTVTNAGQSTGLAVWTCGQILSGYLLDHKQYVQNCQRGVLELGAGTGLCSITAHKLGAKHVIATDGDVDVLHNLRYNVQQNKNTTTIAQTAGVATTTRTFSCPQLVWGQGLETFRRVHGTASVILATDVFYAAHLVQPLWQTVHALLTTSSSEGHFFLAYCPHAVSMDVVLDAAQSWGFTWACPNITTSNCNDDNDHNGKEEVFDDFVPDSSDFGYHIFHFKRKAEQSATW